MIRRRFAGSVLATSCLFLSPACTAASVAGTPAAAADAPVSLAVSPPVGDGVVGLTVTSRVSGASLFRFFWRKGAQDEELPVTPRGELVYSWQPADLAPGVYVIWASAYATGGRLLGSSPLTPLVITPASATTLPPIRGAVRDAS